MIVLHKGPEPFRALIPLEVVNNELAECLEVVNFVEYPI